MPTVVLPGGLALECVDDSEAQLLLGEVERYFDPFELPAGATLIDAGANIGLFSGRAYERLQGHLRVFAFEPMPAVYGMLARNLSGLGEAVQLRPFGLGAREEVLEFSYFPEMPAISSSHRNAHNLEAEQARISRLVLQMVRDGQLQAPLGLLPAEILEPLIEGQIQSRMHFEKVSALVRPLSAVIQEEGLAAIDLLKIDVEGAELEVLEGITQAHWPRIHRLVLECEGYQARTPELGALLQSQGYQVRGTQTRSEEAGDTGLVYAHRPPLPNGHGW